MLVWIGSVAAKGSVFGGLSALAKYLQLASMFLAAVDAAVFIYEFYGTH